MSCMCLGAEEILQEGRRGLCCSGLATYNVFCEITLPNVAVKKAEEQEHLAAHTKCLCGPLGLLLGYFRLFEACISVSASSTDIWRARLNLVYSDQGSLVALQGRRKIAAGGRGRCVCAQFRGGPAPPAGGAGDPPVENTNR